jgi:hypothetical protein
MLSNEGHKVLCPYATKAQTITLSNVGAEYHSALLLEECIPFQWYSSTLPVWVSWNWPPFLGDLACRSVAELAVLESSPHLAWY